jgi:FHA domain
VAAARTYTLLKIKAAGSAPRVILLDTQDLSVGRSEENDLAVDDPEISRRHARFARIEGGWVVEDMGTSNGTAVNGAVSPRAKLASGDVVQIGGAEFVFAETTRNPAELGAKIDLQYASQLKGFGSGASGADGNATILGLMDAVSPAGAEEDFEVRPAGDFDLDLHDIQAGGEPDAQLAAPRDLDAETWELDSALDNASHGLCLQLEIEGLTPALEALLRRLLDRDIELPKLRLRVKKP